MKKKSLIFILGLVPLVPCSSRLGYGLLLAMEVWILFFNNLFAKIICELIELKNLYAKKIFAVLFTIATAIIFSLVVSTLFPLAELTLRFYIYFLAFSYILSFCIDDYVKGYESFSIISFYTAYMVGLSFLRELFFLGSFSFLVSNGFLTVQIVPANFLVFKFLGTNAGAFIIIAISMWVYFSLQKQQIIPFVEN